MSHITLGAAGEIEQRAAGPAPETPAKRRTPWLLLLPGLLYLLVFFVAPLMTLLSLSLSTGTEATGYTFSFAVGNYTDAIAENWPIILRSFLWAGIATVLALAIAYPLAYTIALKSGRWKNILLVLVIAPFFTSFLIRTLAWQTILADNGPIVGFMRDTGMLAVLSWVGLAEPDRVLATPLAVITGLTYNFLPFMTLPLYAALERMDPRLVEAGKDLYASPWTAFRKVTWPLSLPGVVAGTLLTFIPAAGDYINAQLLGSPQTRMIGNVIDAKFLRVLDYPTAASLSVILMISIVLLVMIYIRRAGTEELV